MLTTKVNQSKPVRKSQPQDSSADKPLVIDIEDLSEGGSPMPQKNTALDKTFDDNNLGEDKDGEMAAPDGSN